MARGRIISKSLSTSEKYNALLHDSKGLGEFCQVLYPFLIVHSDDFGRLQGDPSTLKFTCYPGSSRTVREFHAALVKLRDVGLIHWYEIDKKKYLQIIDFEAHQSGLHKRTASKIPPCLDDAKNRTIPGGSGENRGNLHEQNRTEQELEVEVEGKASGNSGTLAEVAAPELAGALAPFAAVAAHAAAAAEVTNLSTISKATNGQRAALPRVAEVEPSRKQKPIFMGTRFSVFDWQVRELEAMVGSDTFDVLEFLFALDSRHSRGDQVIPRDALWTWLQSQVLGEAKRRGMVVVPMASDLSKASTRMMHSMARIEAEERAEMLALGNGGDDDA